MKSDQTVQCDVLTHCAHLYMLYEWVFCSHHPSGRFFFPATENGPKLRKNHELSDREECQEFQLLVVQLFRSQFVDWFEDRLDSRARRFLRMLVPFVVVIVDLEELVYILVASLSHVRRAFFCILVLLEQNQVVDSVCVEHRLDST